MGDRYGKGSEVLLWQIFCIEKRSSDDDLLFMAGRLRDLLFFEHNA